MWILQSEFEELKKEFHGVEFSDKAREELMDVIVTSLRLLIDHLDYDLLLERSDETSTG